jgi:uncharacterized protein involved in outer membrane biogenesis
MRKWPLAVLSVGVVAAVALVALAILLDSDASRSWAINWATAHTGRHIQVDGAFELRLLSSRPSFVAERVTIGNPPWMPPGTTAQIGKLSVAWDWPVPLRESSIQRIEMIDATLHLARAADGRTNWQWGPPNAPKKGPGHLVRSLSMPNARVDLDDARRHLQFTGTVSAKEMPRSGAAPFLRLEGVGKLNGQPAAFALNGDALATARRDRPYRFTYDERSGPGRLTGRGALLAPFNPGVLDTTFEASGSSMDDIYSLVGMHFPNSAPFKLTGNLARRRERSTFTNVQAHFGESDFSGSVALQSVKGQVRFDADLKSKLLRLADLGRHDAQGEAVRKPSTTLLPDAKIPLTGLRNRLGSVHYRAATIASRALSVHDFESTATIERDILTLPTLAARYENAKVTGTVKVDASADSPKTDLDLRIAGLPLNHFFRKRTGGQPPFDGSMHARVQISGRGNSVHQLASTADGMITAVLPRGAMRASLAELTGGNLRGVGLRFSKNEETTPIRCAVASFRAEDGNFTAQHLVIDTEPVLIRGSGAIRMDAEALDLTLHGESKKVRFGSVRSPVYIGGSLAHPSFSLSKGRVAAQTAGAVALGLALTPLAAVLAVVDPGLAKDADCAGLREDVRADAREARTKADSPDGRPVSRR